MKKILKPIFLAVLGSFTLLTSCDDDVINGKDGIDGIDGINGKDGVNGNLSLSTFEKIGAFTNGDDEAFAEISAFDPTTKKLFITNAEDGVISVLDLTDPTNPVKKSDITLPGAPNSVAVNNGILAVAVENNNKQANGTIETYNTDTQIAVASYAAGALPDMVTFSPNGKYLISANEGEPNKAYTVDPEGSITVVEVATGTTTQVPFAGLSNPGNGFRVFGQIQTEAGGNNAIPSTLEQDVEPEYIAVSEDSKTAYIALQENNGFAILDLETKSITKLVGLGTKDYSKPGNEIDASDKDDNVGNLKNWPVLSYYMPDAIDYFTSNGAGFIVSANEGDAREYIDDTNDNEELDDDEFGFVSETRVSKLNLDPTAYPNADWLQEKENLGRLKATTANGDTDNDGDIDQIYGYGARSFSIWNAEGALVYDSGSEIARRTLALAPSIFNRNGDAKTDSRSDDKGAEPESVKVLKAGENTLLFVGLERTSGILVYDINDPLNPQFVKWLEDSNDISPEGLIVINKEDSPTGNYLMIATHEVSSSIAIYEIK
ncbi:choice-of-anchor I family protein [Wenyingzhuangia sp. IMCC45533]